jgi:S1-C subfamily serine protease
MPGRTIAEPVAIPPRAPVATTAAAPGSVQPKPGEIREVRAPDAARAPDKQTADARAMADILTADHPTRSPRAPVELPAPTHGAEVRPAAAAAPGDAIAISRGDLDSALADFARLTAGVRGSFSATGVVIDSVGNGTIFQRAGLRTGDVVTSVDGVRLRTLDDAANLYARASTARAITAQVVRAGKPVTLHVVIQ